MLFLSNTLLLRPCEKLCIGRTHAKPQIIKTFFVASLNKIKRQRELLRITHENLAILKRITTKDPHYNHKRWLYEWQVCYKKRVRLTRALVQPSGGTEPRQFAIGGGVRVLHPTNSQGHTETVPRFKVSTERLPVT